MSDIKYIDTGRIIECDSGAYIHVEYGFLRSTTEAYSLPELTEDEKLQAGINYIKATYRCPVTGTDT